MFFSLAQEERGPFPGARALLPRPSSCVPSSASLFGGVPFLQGKTGAEAYPTGPRTHRLVLGKPMRDAGLPVGVSGIDDASVPYGA